MGLCGFYRVWRLLLALVMGGGAEILDILQAHILLAIFKTTRLLPSSGLHANIGIFCIDLIYTEFSRCATPGHL